MAEEKRNNPGGGFSHRGTSARAGSGTGLHRKTCLGDGVAQSREVLPFLPLPSAIGQAIMHVVVDFGWEASIAR